MCIPHNIMHPIDYRVIKEKKPKKHIQKPSKEMLEKGDPDFVDERTSSYKPKKKGSFLNDFFS